ncbi:restriction endonuclease subunit R [Ornithobacterium rhinotracheale]|uniref:type I restriction enzyme HsdR N-terminal domain-containing protein n=1 Tax=Ornithobacterium rhinotracheale TaxID=28251 RepID=UPI00129CDCBF|nr:type I restriction enzyme HsdR N-terminal domain-containing protein [Ornithobacterium rhinotracheale]MRI63875.1 restriction endonuclease subunit R [Ornithobacterium rhinotracheale]
MNKNIWNLYKESQRGKDAIALFTFRENSDVIDWARGIINRYEEYLGGDGVLEMCLTDFYFSLVNLIADDLKMIRTETSSEYFSRLADTIEIVEVVENEKGDYDKVPNGFIVANKFDFKTLSALVPEISLALHFLLPDKFFPILFREQFDIFLKILDVLKIPMPELPAKTDKKGRFLLYSKINDELLNFAKKNNLTPEETCACIYDFSFLLLNENNSNEEMPEPTNVWLTGGSKEDFRTFLINPKKGDKSVWTCNENTKRGDIIVMYVLSPYSCIQSIWRAEIDGVYTPFNYYNSRTRAIDGIVVPEIKLKELKSHPYFSKLPITRKNFQGVNGVNFTANDYKELQKLLIERGFDISNLPQLFSPDLDISIEIKNEKDIEEKLLIPLLNKLGYNTTDWSRQLSQKAGRKEKAIPDFVFLAKGEKHFQNAPMIIEAKFDMSSNIERTKAYNQALSYARMMNSSIFGICDKDRLIIYRENDGYFDRFNPIFEKHWQNINDKETFRQLKKIIGKKYLE